jgi:cytosine/adenosine deaminase-related metal-dependent hydrolase
MKKLLLLCIIGMSTLSCVAADKAARKAKNREQQRKQAEANHEAWKALMSPGHVNPHLHSGASFTYQMQIHNHNQQKKQ